MTYVIFSLSSVVVFVALATLLHVQFGLTGIVNFGVVGFWGVGLYALGIFLVEYELPYVLALLLATVVTGVVALLLGLVILDMDGQSVLVATLAFATIVFHLVTTEKDLTGGVTGLGTVPIPFDVGRHTESVYLLMLTVAAAALILYAAKLRRAPYWRLLVAIKDNEPLARSLGKPTFREKVVVFTITCAAMGLLGALSASLYQFLVPRMLLPGLTFTVWIALILGGRSRALGGFVGVMATVFVFDFVIETYAPVPGAEEQMVPNIKFMLYGLMLVLVIMFRPEGILGRPRPSPRPLREVILGPLRRLVPVEGDEPRRAGG
jgi:branched-chain amino acid transport system permease protein